MGKLYNKGSASGSPVGFVETPDRRGAAAYLILLR